MIRTINIGSIKLSKPCLDVETRWNSTFDMLRSLLPFKPYSQGIKKSVTEKDWQTINNLTEALKSIKITTKLLQSEQLTMPSFVWEWKKCLIKIKKVQNTFSIDLQKKIEARQIVLFSSPVVLSAMFLDPRLNGLLSNQEIECAKKHLQELWEKVENLTEPGESSKVCAVIEEQENVDQENSLAESLGDSEDIMREGQRNKKLLFTITQNQIKKKIFLIF